MPTIEEKLKSLRALLTKKDNLVIFAGAGISIPPPSSELDWNQLAVESIKRASEQGIDAPTRAYAEKYLSKSNYYKVFDILSENLTEPTYIGIVSELLKPKPGYSDNDLHKLIFQSKIKAVITTNFDQHLENAFAKIRGAAPFIVTWQQPAEIKQLVAAVPANPYIFKMHGTGNVPRSMVLRTEQCKEVAQSLDISSLIRNCARESQFVFVGYGFNDPNFQQLWTSIIEQLYFSQPAIYIAEEGQWPADRLEAARKMHLEVLEFPNPDKKYEFVKQALTAIKEESQKISTISGVSAPDANADELARYLFFCLDFSQSREQRQKLFYKSLVMSIVAKHPEGLKIEPLLLEVRSATGLLSAQVIEMVKLAIAGLESDGVLKYIDELISGNAKTIKSIDEKILSAEAKVNERLKLSLLKYSKTAKQDILDVDLKRLQGLYVKCLQVIGLDLARQFVLLQPGTTETQAISTIVTTNCGTDVSAPRREMYKNVLVEFFLRPAAEDEESLFQHIQAYFITSAFLLDPASESLMRDFVKQHRVYFDASIILPALATGQYGNEINRKLIAKTQSLGISCFASTMFLDEVHAHFKSAIRQFQDFETSGGEMSDLLSSYVIFNGGEFNGNVFLAGLHGRYQAGYEMPWKNYLKDCVGTSDHSISLEEFALLVAERLGLAVDDGKKTINAAELGRITAEIEEWRGAGSRKGNNLLCEHEAQQFLLIHHRRAEASGSHDKVWFVTTDRTILRLQKEEIKKYPLPIAHTPKSWFQFLDLIDFESRSHRHFSRLHPHAYYGAIMGDLGMSAIKTLLREREDLFRAGLLKAKDLATEAIRNSHVKQTIKQYADLMSQGAVPSDPEPKELRAKLVAELENTAASVIAVKEKDWAETLKSEKKLSNKNKELEKQLKSKDFKLWQAKKALKEHQKKNK